MRPPRVHLIIDRVVLHGLPAGRRDDYLRAIEAQFAERLSDAAFVATLRSGTIATVRRTSTDQAASARSVAASIAGGVTATLGGDLP